jgi:putative hemolysin
VIGIKETLRHLSDGKPLGMFPAGEVSSYKDGKLMVDKPWEEGAIKVIRKAQVPVVPIYFHARKWLFYFLPKSVAPFVLQNYHQFLVRNVAS